MRKGMLVVVSGASGTGKGTVCAELLKEEPTLAYSISATTRAPREGEENGKNYYFLTREAFKAHIEAGDFLEYADIYGNYYGTPLPPILKRLEAGEDILLEIDIQGALNVMKKYPGGLFIFLLPPSIEELRRRLTGRGTESEESLTRRMASAKKEIAVGKQYQYVVVNDDVARATRDIRAILLAERSRVSRNESLFKELEAE